MPQTRQQISAARAEVHHIVRTCGHDIVVENFFPIVVLDTCLSYEDIGRQSCVMVPRWRLFGDFLGSAFPASHAQQISYLQSKFALGHTMCRSMVDIQSAAAEIRRGKKLEERNHRAKI